MKKIVVAVLCIGQVAMVNGMRGDLARFDSGDPLSVDGQPNRPEDYTGDRREGKLDGQGRRKPSDVVSSNLKGSEPQSDRVNPFSKPLGPVDTRQPVIIVSGDAGNQGLSREEIAKLDVEKPLEFDRRLNIHLNTPMARGSRVEIQRLNQNITSLAKDIDLTTKSVAFLRDAFNGSENGSDEKSEYALRLGKAEKALKLLKLRKESVELDKQIYILETMKASIESLPKTTDSKVLKQAQKDKVFVESQLTIANKNRVILDAEIKQNMPEKSFWSSLLGRIDD